MPDLLSHKERLQGMTDHEKAIVMAYTGYAMLVGDRLKTFYDYVESKVGYRPMTHELASQRFIVNLHDASKDDFIELCKEEDQDDS